MEDLKTEAVYNKQECINSFMSRKSEDETENDLRLRIMAKNNELSQRGHQLNKARKALEQMQAEFDACKGEVDGLINFAFSREIKLQEAAEGGGKKASEQNGRDHSEEVGHGA